MGVQVHLVALGVERTGQSQSEVSDIVQGRQMRDVTVLERIAEGLGMPRERELGELRARRDLAAQEETDLSYLRRLLHARIDIVRAEQHHRREGGSAPVVAELARILAENAVGPATGSGRHQTLLPSQAEAHRRHVEALIADVDLSDVSALSSDTLDDALTAYQTEETSVSQRRREVQHVVSTTVCPFSESRRDRRYHLWRLESTGDHSVRRRNWRGTTNLWRPVHSLTRWVSPVS